MCFIKIYFRNFQPSTSASGTGPTAGASGSGGGAKDGRGGGVKNLPEDVKLDGVSSALSSKVTEVSISKRWQAIVSFRFKIQSLFGRMKNIRWRNEIRKIQDIFYILSNHA